MSHQEEEDRLARANAIRLAAGQALGGINTTVIVTTGAIVGSILAPHASLATVPVSSYVVGTAASTIPVGALSRRLGRRPTFFIGCSVGFAVGLVGAAAIYLASFWLFCLATFLGGFFQAVVLTFRFAVTDAASPAFRPKALSWVMAGGIFSGIFGPQMVSLTMNLWQPWLYMASFLTLCAFAIACALVVSGTRLPPPPPKAATGGRPLGQIARQPRFLVAVLGAVVSYALMNLLMTSAPLAMKMCGLSIATANHGVQWHITAMYLPSFWTGALVARYGAPRIVTLGLLLIALAAVTGLTGQSTWHFWLGLVLLGIGWNFGFIGSSTLVVETHLPEERNRVQAFNDFIVFGSMAVASFSSGQLLAHSGWAAVNWVVFPPVLFALGALTLAGAYRARPVAAA